MPSIQEQFTAAIKAHAEAQHAINAALSEKIIERLEELAKLNIDAVKAAVAESTATAQELLYAKDPQEFFQASASHIKRDIQNTMFYACEATRIASTTQTEITKAAAEKNAEASRHGTALLTELTKNVPANAEQMVNILKSAMVTARQEFVKKTRDGAAEQAFADAASRKKTNNQAAGTTH